ncbi:MAG: DinB family protein [Phycisphaerae bacterium]
MSQDILKCGFAALEFARKCTNSYLEAIPTDKWFHTPCENGNHAMWIIGHLAYADDLFLSVVNEGRGTKLDTTWAERFGMKSTPSANAADYPEASEVRKTFDDMRNELFAFYEALPLEQLADPTPEEFQAFAPNKGQLLLTAACHESTHNGQLTVIRKSLKLEPVFA